MSKLKILYTSSEISPFLQITEVANYVNNLLQFAQESEIEIRAIVPRFGLINERKNRLHEVIRLSGINISVKEEQKILVIKVASIPNTKIQVYFIDNEDYFHRKFMFTDKKQNFYKDNDERMIFFCKGVIEAVKKLGWFPNIVHCNDWISSLIPMYLRTKYNDDPMFKNTKIVFTIYNTHFDYKFGNGHFISEKLTTPENQSQFFEFNYENLIKIGIAYSDAIVKSSSELDIKLNGIFKNFKDKNVSTIELKENYGDFYLKLYKELLT